MRLRYITFRWNIGIADIHRIVVAILTDIIGLFSKSYTGLIKSMLVL